MAANFRRATATGDAYAGEGHLQSLVLAAGSDAATVDVRDGSGGAIVLTLKAVANTSESWTSGDGDGIYFTNAIHVTLAGTGPSVTAEVG